MGKGINREAVLDAALLLAQEEGLAGLSMRKLAKRLGIEAMSLYNHFANKADILDGLAERVYGDVARPDPALPWQERVRTTALGMYRALSRYPVVPLALVTDQANPTSERALRSLEDLLEALYAAGFDDTQVRRALSAINGLIMGSLLLSTAGFTGDFYASRGAEQLDHFRQGVDAERLPHFTRLLGVLPDIDAEADFTAALDMLITGIADAAGRLDGA
ncbi:TetR/AcrR family transcriptional regulator C-terminal domain-containing protein [Nonomuraea sediminis]|uniref:TetR/AcrR family transcriptional regulator C-terminal domain-containing protein n=1 Tax=Nonomuraea sediminis TaxID=2835864 RepID=UPI001BDC1908|nr:TetR/AcrR family transcriptional regulator C-terminal domain-containing protein [Nonomuraea sediminis]